MNPQFDCGYRSARKDTSVTLFSFPSSKERLEKWISAIPNPPPSPKRKNARICSLHFFIEDFKVFSTFKKALNDDAVPKAGLCYKPSNHSVSNTSLGGQSSEFNSPLGASFLSPCSPSPHINKDTLRRNYGSKSRRELFTVNSTQLDDSKYCSVGSSREGSNPDNATSDQHALISMCGSPIGKRKHSTPHKDTTLCMKKCRSHPSHRRHSLCSEEKTGPSKNRGLLAENQESDSTNGDKSLCQTLLGTVSSPGQNIFNVTATPSSDHEQPMPRKRRNDSTRVAALREKLIQKNRTINKLRMQVKRSKHPKSASLSAREIVAAARPHLKPAMRILLEAQLKLSSRKKKGMRWSQEMKDFTLGLMYHGPRCYRYLSKLIPLPSISTINRYQSVLHLKPGIHEHVKLGLKDIVTTWSQNKKICTLVIDGMSIKRHLEYDNKRDFVSGFTDDGLNRSRKPANQGIVAVLKGILSPWKQIVGHWLTTDTDPADIILKAVKDCVAFANETGLILKLFVCDPGSKNRKLVRALGITRDKPYFMNGDQKVFFVWDPPHLIKNVRNNLLKNDFLWRGQVVSWKHIRNLYFAQKQMRLKLTPKLTRRHVIFRNSFAKMKVKLATQVFSNSVNVALLTFVAFNRLPSSAVHTACCCKDLNDLFDCFNSMQFVKDKLTLRYAIGPRSEHISFLDPKLLDYLDKAAFLGVKRQPFVLKDWVVSIRGLLMLVEDLSQTYNTKSIRTRLLNQDTLENTFSTLRQQDGCSDNPTTKQLERGLRMTSLSSLLKLSASSNCEDEMEKAVLGLKNLPTELFSKKKQLSSTDILSLTETETFDLNENVDLDIIEECALYYCCGFITRQFARKHKCPICEFKLLVDPDERMLLENYQMFMYFKAHSNKLGSDFGHLKAPSFESFEILKKIDNLFHQIFKVRSHEKNIALKIRLAIDEAGLRLNLCTEDAEDEFLSTLIRTRILWEVRFMNRRFEEERIEEQDRRKLKKLQGKDAAGSSKEKKGSSSESECTKKIVARCTKRKGEEQESERTSTKVGTWAIQEVTAQETSNPPS